MATVMHWTPFLLTTGKRLFLTRLLFYQTLTRPFHHLSTKLFFQRQGECERSTSLILKTYVFWKTEESGWTSPPRDWVTCRFGPMQGNPRQSWILDSMHGVDSGFQGVDSGLCQWNLDSGFQLLLGSAFLELYSRFQRPNLGFRKQTFPGFRNPVNGAIGNVRKFSVVAVSMVHWIRVIIVGLFTNWTVLDDAFVLPRGVALETYRFEDLNDHEGKIWLKAFFTYSQKLTLWKASFSFFFSRKVNMVIFIEGG